LGGGIIPLQGGAIIPFLGGAFVRNLHQNTGRGRGGQYRYYCCSRKLKEAQTACQGMRIRMDKLDGIAIGEVVKRVLEPERLTEMLQSYVKAASERENTDRDRLAKLRHEQKDAEAGIMRLLELVEKGLMHAEDAELRDRLIALKLRRDEVGREISDLQKRMASGEPRITPEKVGRLAVLLRDKLHDGPPELRQAYARLLMDEVSVSEEEIRISGSKAVLARVASDGADMPTPAVLSFVREWRAQGVRTPVFAVKGRKTSSAVVR
jgi:hypothetical protein